MLNFICWWLLLYNMYREIRRQCGRWDFCNTCVSFVPISALIFTWYIFEYNDKSYYFYQWHSILKWIEEFIFFSFSIYGFCGWAVVYGATKLRTKTSLWRRTGVWWTIVLYYPQRLFWYKRCEYFRSKEVYSNDIDNNKKWLKREVKQLICYHHKFWFSNSTLRIRIMSYITYHWFIFIYYLFLVILVFEMRVYNFYFKEEIYDYLMMLWEREKWYLCIVHFVIIWIIYFILGRRLSYYLYRTHRIDFELGVMFKPRCYPHRSYFTSVRDILIFNYLHQLGWIKKEYVKYIEDNPFILEKSESLNYEISMFWIGWLHKLNDAPVFIISDSFKEYLNYFIRLIVRYKILCLILNGGNYNYNFWGKQHRFYFHNYSDIKYPTYIKEKKWWHETL